MEERFSVSEAARELEISRTTLYAWLEKEPEMQRQLDKHHTLTRQHLNKLASTYRKKHKPTLSEVDSALSERIEALEAKQEALEARINTLERIAADDQPTQKLPKV